MGSGGGDDGAIDEGGFHGQTDSQVRHNSRALTKEEGSYTYHIIRRSFFLPSAKETVCDGRGFPQTEELLNKEYTLQGISFVYALKYMRYDACLIVDLAYCFDNLLKVDEA